MPSADVSAPMRDGSVARRPASLEHVETLVEPDPLGLRRKSRRSKGAHDGDRPDDGVVERVKLFGRNPVLLVMARAHRVTFVPRDMVRPHSEASDEAASVVAGVPAFGDLD